MGTSAIRPRVAPSAQPWAERPKPRWGFARRINIGLQLPFRYGTRNATWAWHLHAPKAFGPPAQGDRSARDERPTPKAFWPPGQSCRDTPQVQNCDRKRQRRSGFQPRVAATRLPWVYDPHPLRQPHRGCGRPRVAPAHRDNPGPETMAPLGPKVSTSAHLADPDPTKRKSLYCPHTPTPLALGGPASL